jgi:putative transcriptional regulator
MTSDKLHLDPDPETNWLTGQLLIAMPAMPDARFARAVIYICSHGPNGAMGLVINRLYGEVNFQMLLKQLNVKSTTETPDLPVHYGGPVETGRGFVLHSNDYSRDGTIRVDDNFALSASLDVLQALAAGNGPQRALMTLGYTGWGAGQLDAEMQANGWLTADADEALLFDTELETKWERSLAKMGVSATMLSAEAGHA